MKELKKHVPLAVVAAIAGVALLRTPKEVATSPVVVQSLAYPAGHPSGFGAHMIDHAQQKTRLVSCGNSKRARLEGDDTHGEVFTGGSRSCTILFAAPWAQPPICIASGGEITKLLPTEMVVKGTHFTYDCK